jgi:pseudouridine synthase
VVYLDKPLEASHVKTMESGMTLEGEILLPAGIGLAPEFGANAFRIAISEGKNRQIRRMCETFGYTVQRLIRVKIGGYELHDIEAGKFKKMTTQDLALLRG